MTFIDHQKGEKGADKILAVAFGRHIVEGDLMKSTLNGSAIVVQHLLGEAFGTGWKQIVGAWFRSIVRPPAKYVFHPGKASSGASDPIQGVDSVFDLDTPHSNTAWIRLECPSGTETGIPDPDTKTNPPTGASCIVDCQTGSVYDDAGDVAATDQLLINPADVLAFGCLTIQRMAASRMNWSDLEGLRQICNQDVTADYTAEPEGIGILASYYSGTNFDTLIRTRIDPNIDFPSSTNAPDVGQTVDNFSVRFEGKISARYSESYTFSVLHDDGAKLWVNGTLIVDQWTTAGTHTGTVTLAANTLTDIKLEWKDVSGAAAINLSWSSTSQTSETVPQSRLFPKPKTEKRFAAHHKFDARTNFEDFLRQILFSCNGTWQDADGKLKFFCVSEVAPAFAFSNANIVEGTFKIYPRFSQTEIQNLPNRFIADGRDLDSRFIEKFTPECFYDLPELQTLAGRIIEETVNVGNTTRRQAMENLKYYAKLKTAPAVCEFEGTPPTYPVLPGDLVTVTKADYGLSAKQFLVIEATDKSIDAGADERIFKLLEWTTTGTDGDGGGGDGGDTGEIADDGGKDGGGGDATADPGGGEEEKGE